MEVQYPPPLKRGISAILARYPMKIRQMGAIPPLCDTISKGYCAIWGGISHWAAKISAICQVTETFLGNQVSLRGWHKIIAGRRSFKYVMPSHGIENSLNSVQTGCIVKGEAQITPLVWRFSVFFDFLRSACSLGLPHENL